MAHNMSLNKRHSILPATKPSWIRIWRNTEENFRSYQPSSKLSIFPMKMWTSVSMALLDTLQLRCRDAPGIGKMKARTAEPEIFMKGGSATFTKGAVKSSPAADWENPDWSLLKKLCEVSATDGQIECAAFGATLEIGRLAQRAACSGTRGRWCLCVWVPAR